MNEESKIRLARVVLQTLSSKLEILESLLDEEGSNFVTAAAYHNDIITDIIELLKEEASL